MPALVSWFSVALKMANSSRLAYFAIGLAPIFLSGKRERSIARSGRIAPK